MLKKIFISLTLFLFITNCGFTPLYSINDIDNANFEILSYEGDKEINLNLISKFKSSSNTKEKPYKVDILTNYEKKTLTKNLAGEPEEYQLLLSVEFTVLKDNSQIKLKLNEKFVMNNFSDDFEERNYETNIKKSMVNLIYNKFLKQIRNLK
jgi:outer membrane lipopolysaccharide assembly protein LptE/RlpB